MNAVRMKNELLAVRARIDAILEDVERDGDPANDSPWMKVPAYARHARVSPRTVLRWIAAASPGPGKEHPWAADEGTRTVRVNREKCDEWRATR